MWEKSQACPQVTQLKPGKIPGIPANLASASGLAVTGQRNSNQRCPLSLSQDFPDTTAYRPPPHTLVKWLSSQTEEHSLYVPQLPSITAMLWRLSRYSICSSNLRPSCKVVTFQEGDTQHLPQVPTPPGSRDIQDPTTSTLPMEEWIPSDPATGSSTQ